MLGKGHDRTEINKNDNIFLEINLNFDNYSDNSIIKYEFVYKK